MKTGELRTVAFKLFFFLLLINACNPESDSGLLGGDGDIDVENAAEVEADGERSEDILEADAEGGDGENYESVEIEDAEPSEDEVNEDGEEEIEVEQAEDVESDDDLTSDGVHIIPDREIMLVEEDWNSEHCRAFRLKNFTDHGMRIDGIRLSDDSDGGFFFKNDLPLGEMISPYAEKEFRVCFVRPGGGIYKSEVLVKIHNHEGELKARLYAMSQSQYECKSLFKVVGAYGQDMGELREGWRYGLSMNLAYEGMEGNTAEISSVEAKAFRYRQNDPGYDQVNGVVGFSLGENYHEGPFDVGDIVSDWGYIDFGLNDPGRYFILFKINYILHPSKQNCFEEIPDQVERSYSINYKLYLPTIYEIDPNADYYQAGQSDKDSQKLPWEGLNISVCSEENGTTKLSSSMTAVWSDDKGLTFFGGADEFWTLDERSAPGTLSCAPNAPGSILSMAGLADRDEPELWAGLDEGIARFENSEWSLFMLPPQMLHEGGSIEPNKVVDIEVIDARVFALNHVGLGVFDPQSETWSIIDIPPNLDRTYGLHSDGEYLWGMAGTELYKIDASGAAKEMDACELDLKYHYDALIPPAEVLYVPDPKPCNLANLGVIGAEASAIWIATYGNKSTVWRYNRNSSLERVLARNGGGYNLNYEYSVGSGMGGTPLLSAVGVSLPPEYQNPLCEGMYYMTCRQELRAALVYPGIQGSDFSKPFMDAHYCYPRMFCQPLPINYDKAKIWRGSSSLWIARGAARINW